MSGIAGWIVGARQEKDEAALLPMLEALAHRHAAGETLLACTQRRRDEQVVLGATVSDPATGIAVALDGAFSNALELRKDLKKRGFRIGEGVAETLLRAYQFWDKDVVRHLEGAFAFALWDPRKGRLLLARDRFGEKPLFLAQRDGGLFFASEAKALLAAPGARAKADVAAMRACLADGYLSGTGTLFQGLRRLAPATYALWQFGRLQETRYWIPPDRHPWTQQAQADEAGAFRARLEQATRARSADGVLLSGGIDSAALVALLAQDGRAVKTFTLGFEGDPRSELPQAAAVAKHFGTRHHEIVVKPAELLPELAAHVARHDGPVPPSVLPMHRLATEAARSAKSVLSGDGCDEVVGGYRRLVAERLHPGFCESLERRGERWAARLMPEQPPAAPASDADPAASPLRRVLYAHQTTRLPNRILERDDFAGTGQGLRIELPYLDHRLAECVSGLADDRRVRGLATKWILREAARHLVPAGLAPRKAGFRLPIRDWLRNELRDTLAEHLQGGGSQTRRYYDAAVLDRLVSEHLHRKHDHHATLWTLLNLEIWHRRYNPG